MKYQVSRVDKGHYECYYQGLILSIYKVDPSMVFLDEKGNKQLWMCRIDEKCTPVWADRKRKVIEKAIKYLNKKQHETNRTTTIH
jgi:hypothetical protein